MQFKRVAVIGEPSFITASSLLSVLMSRASYVSIDPSWPLQRINWILKHSGAAAVLTNSLDFSKNSLKDIHLPLSYVFLIKKSRDYSLKGCQQFSIIEYFKAQKKTTHIPSKDSLIEKKIPNDFVKSNDSLVYIMYTSGSSGHPKGVEVKLQALDKFLSWIEREISNFKRGIGFFMDLL